MSCRAPKAIDIEWARSPQMLEDLSTDEGNVQTTYDYRVFDDRIDGWLCCNLNLILLTNSLQSWACGPSYICLISEPPPFLRYQPCHLFQAKAWDTGAWMKHGWAVIWAVIYNTPPKSRSPTLQKETRWKQRKNKFNWPTRLLTISPYMQNNITGEIEKRISIEGTNERILGI